MITTTAPKKPSKTRTQKVSVTLRIPSDLKDWADTFAENSHMDISSLFIQSLRETQRRGELRIAPSGYRDAPVAEFDFSHEKWSEIQDLVVQHENQGDLGHSQRYEWEEYRKILSSQL